MSKLRALLRFLGRPSARNALATAAGATAGGLLGSAQNKMWEQTGVDWHPYTQGGTIAGNAILGALIARSPRIRRRLLNRLTTKSYKKLPLAGGGFRVEHVKELKPRLVSAVLGWPALGLASGLGLRLGEGTKQLTDLMGTVRHSPKVSREIYRLREDPKGTIQSYITPGIEKGVSKGLGDVGSRAGRAVSPAAKDMLRNLGYSAGGGLAGWYGGGEIGSLVGNLLFPKDESAEYEDRVEAHDRRQLAETLGNIAGVYSGVIGAPLLANYLGGSKNAT